MMGRASSEVEGFPPPRVEILSVEGAFSKPSFSVCKI
jgi:hypothetical protein